MKKVFVVLCVGLLVVGLSAVFGCGKKEAEEPVTETTAPGETTTKPDISTSEGEALPTKDVPGEDLEVTPRYPGSVRVEYSKDSDGFTKVSYQTKDSVDKVSEYYHEKMTSSGWQLDSSEESQLVFEKEPSRLYVLLYYYEDDQITEYELKYFPE